MLGYFVQVAIFDCNPYEVGSYATLGCYAGNQRLLPTEAATYFVRAGDSLLVAIAKLLQPCTTSLCEAAIFLLRTAALSLLR